MPSIWGKIGWCGAHHGHLGDLWKSTAMEMAGTLTVALLKPEIATGFYDFRSTIEPVASGSSSSDTVSAPSAASAAAAVEATSNLNGNPAGIGDPAASANANEQQERAAMFPDGQVVQLCLDRIRQEGFQIRGQRMLQLTRADARNLLRQSSRDHPDQLHRRLELLARAPSLVVLLFLPQSLNQSGTGSVLSAVGQWKRIMGADDPAALRKQLQGTPTDQWPLRALCGLNVLENGLSGSESSECAIREMTTFFPHVKAPLTNAAILLTQDFVQRFPSARDVMTTSFDLHGIMILDSKEIQVETIEERELLYDSDVLETDHGFKARFHDLIVERKSWLLLVEGMDVVNKLRVLVGPPSMSQAATLFPDSLRARFARAIGGDDSSKSVVADGVLLYHVPRQVQQIRTLWFASCNVVEKTFAIIKPDVASCREKVTKIQDSIVAYGFVIEDQRHLHLTREQAQEFYAEHFGKVFFERLVRFMTSGPIIVMCLRRKQAIVMWRKLMGPTNSLKARETHPWTLRACYGTDGTQNATHGSDSPTSAVRELGIFFPKIAAGFLRINSIRAYAAQPLPLPYKDSTLEQLLSEALYQLCQTRPGQTTEESCRWLGNYLLQKKKTELELNANDKKKKASDSQGNKKSKRSMRHGQERRQSKDLASPNVASGGKMIGLSYEEKYVQTAKAIEETITTKFKHLAVDVGEMIKSCSIVSDAILKLQSALAVVEPTQRILLTNLPLDNSEFCAQFRQKVQAMEMVFEVSGRRVTSRADTLGNMGSNVVLDVSQPLELLRERVESCLESVFVLVDDPSTCLSPKEWTGLAEQYGFSCIEYRAMLQEKLETERDANGIATRLVRSGAHIPDDLLHDWLIETIESRRQRDHHKLLLVGFPWRQITPTRLERLGCGRCECFVSLTKHPNAVLLPAPVEETDCNNKWQRWFQQQGIWRRIEPTNDRNGVVQSVGDVLSPVVGFCLSSSGEIPLEVREIAHRRHFAWIKVQELASAASGSVDQVISQLKDLVFYQARGPRKLILEGFPRTQEDFIAFTKCILSKPHFMLQLGTQLDKNQTLALQPLEQDVSIPKALVDLSAKENKFDLVKRFLLAKQVTLVVGDHAALSLNQLQSVLDSSKMDAFVLDASQIEVTETSMDSEAASLLQRLDRCIAGECVVVGVPESTVFMHKLLNECGQAIQRLIVLRQMPIQRPKTKQEEEEERDLYSDEEEAEQARAEKDFASIRSSLRQLMGLFQQRERHQGTSSPSSIALAAAPGTGTGTATGTATATATATTQRLVTIKFVDAQEQQVVHQIRLLLRPALVGILASPLSGYQQVLKSCAKRLGMGILDVHEESFKQPVETSQELSTLIAKLCERVTHQRRFFGSFLVDGFPRTNTTGGAPYVAEQLWSLERELGEMKLIISWQVAWSQVVRKAQMQPLGTTSTPAALSTQAVEEEQDRLETATQDLVEFWRKKKRPLMVIQTEGKETSMAMVQQQLLDTLRSI